MKASLRARSSSRDVSQYHLHASSPCLEQSQRGVLPLDLELSTSSLHRSAYLSSLYTPVSLNSLLLLLNVVNIDFDTARHALSLGQPPILSLRVRLSSRAPAIGAPIGQACSAKPRTTATGSRDRIRKREASCASVVSTPSTQACAGTHGGQCHGERASAIRQRLHRCHREMPHTMAISPAPRPEKGWR